MRLALLVSALVACNVVFAQSLTNASLASGPMGHAVISISGDPSIQYGPIISYSNVTTFLGYYFPGYSYGDDLNMVTGGLVNGFKFGYYDPMGGTALTSLDVWFHDLTGGVIGALLASYTLTLPGDGLWTVTVNLTGSEFAAPKDILMSLLFSRSNSPEAGWLMYDPPTVGSSQDVFYIWDLAGWYWFGGNPKANFGAEIAMVPEPGTLAALGVGLVGLLALRRRK